MGTSSGVHFSQGVTLSCSLGQNPERSHGCLEENDEVAWTVRGSRNHFLQTHKGKYN